MSPTASISSSAVDVKRLLKLGEAVETARGLEFLDALQEFKQVREVNSAVKLTITKLGKAKIAFHDSASTLADASAVLKTRSDRAPEIRRTMDLFALSDGAFSKEAFDLLRER
ncbi:MAG: hypothetical protein ACRYFU_13525 [Janthinobacterium lividum]